MKTIVLLFHPNLTTSRVNRQLSQALTEDIVVRDMYQLYPDFYINIQAEQQLLTANQRIVLQFPMYWYSAPALLKQWECDALQGNFGGQGTALAGKELVIAVSPGANNYGREQFVQYTVNELLRPFQATCHLIKMQFMQPFVTLGASSLSTAQLQQQAQKYNQYLHMKHLTPLATFG